MDTVEKPETPFSLPKPWIMEQAEKYLRNTDKARHRRLKAAGELDAYLNTKFDDVKDEAESLISSGEFPNQAWHWAVRTQIFGMEPD